ncbi:hypothetical protein Nepgr_002591 [Nepenthes gracilis]|uniref:Uncharacterized protein n=1 Tax=Nepenthes gracilis TaxID=150966 RepID=A0AAD3RX07_NEPGR|nr:hypothetical protein Nepgr_002591 [Nepenthes gracilis]
MPIAGLPIVAVQLLGCKVLLLAASAEVQGYFDAIAGADLAKPCWSRPECLLCSSWGLIRWISPLVAVLPFVMMHLLAMYEGDTAGRCSRV